MSENKFTVLIAAGGTGGHIFPALAVADALAKNGAAVFWIGSENSMEQKLILGRYPFQAMAIRGLRQKGWKSWLLAPWKIFSAVLISRKYIQKIQPDVVLCMGGFVSGPAGIAAKLSGKYLVIHEQNSIAGLTNRFLSYFSDRVLRAFPSAFPKNKKAEVIGNPLRENITQVDAPATRFAHRKNPLRLLVLGGSQGARFINQNMIAAFEKMKAYSFEVRHQTGERDYTELSEKYKNLSNVQATVLPFIQDIAEAYAWADFVIARAGALTVSEIAVVGVGSILIPYPFAVDNHQLFNAHFLADANAAWIMEEKDCSVEKFCAQLKKLSDDRTLLLEMAEAARNLACPDATEKLVQILSATAS